ncbi:hypothetical protein PEPS_47000 (plasmid) [Persicobacter psychrovividus]|uniref:Uncharacterized protein n=2 Tax=Persicobacter psychrovividus TaxID=387638 RepID=A0ABM7VN48_9BACT|nr:hypothetical protein PEPS_47000 [Persicobacter psychrovividus]
MRSYIVNTFKSLKDKSKQLSEESILIGKRWVLFDDQSQDRIIYIFQKEKQLLVSRNGEVTIGQWQYIDGQNIMISINNHHILLNHGFVDDEVLALRMDSKEDYIILCNESKGLKSLKSIQFLERYLEEKYLLSKGKKTVHGLNTPILEYPQGSYVCKSRTGQEIGLINFCGSESLNQNMKVWVNFEQNYAGVQQITINEESFELEIISGVISSYFWIVKHDVKENLPMIIKQRKKSVNPMDVLVANQFDDGWYQVDDLFVEVRKNIVNEVLESQNMECCVLLGYNDERQMPLALRPKVNNKLSIDDYVFPKNITIKDFLFFNFSNRIGAQVENNKVVSILKRSIWSKLFESINPKTIKVIEGEPLNPFYTGVV